MSRPLGAVEVMFPLRNRALGLDLEEQAVACVDKVRCAIDSGAGHARFFDASVIGVVGGGRRVGNIVGISRRLQSATERVVVKDTTKAVGGGRFAQLADALVAGRIVGVFIVASLGCAPRTQIVDQPIRRISPRAHCAPYACYACFNGTPHSSQILGLNDIPSPADGMVPQLGQR